mmetsp:Transcript_15055/g.26427  ORF Transcript_15055/g.26427 Transcript_15055/m.26427 type:complete len:467 (+) Transcript_15055:633-2033(+)
MKIKVWNSFVLRTIKQTTKVVVDKPPVVDLANPGRTHFKRQEDLSGQETRVVEVCLGHSPKRIHSNKEVCLVGTLGVVRLVRHSLRTPEVACSGVTRTLVGQHLVLPTTNRAQVVYLAILVATLVGLVQQTHNPQVVACLEIPIHLEIINLVVDYLETQTRNNHPQGVGCLGTLVVQQTPLVVVARPLVPKIIPNNLVDYLVEILVVGLVQPTTTNNRGVDSLEEHLTLVDSRISSRVVVFLEILQAHQTLVAGCLVAGAQIQPNLVADYLVVVGTNNNRAEVYLVVPTPTRTLVAGGCLVVPTPTLGDFLEAQTPTLGLVPQIHRQAVACLVVALIPILVVDYSVTRILLLAAVACLGQPIPRIPVVACSEVVEISSNRVEFLAQTNLSSSSNSSNNNSWLLSMGNHMPMAQQARCIVTLPWQKKHGNQLQILNPKKVQVRQKAISYAELRHRPAMHLHQLERSK